MHPIDVAVVVGYMAAVVWAGRALSRHQRSVRDYFLTGRSVPWWAVSASIVATETSTITVISVPGYAFGGDLTFLQIALGYIVGRIFVALVLLPTYFRSDVLTAYQIVRERFGRTLGRLTAAVFLVTRNVSDGLRLFATGIVLAVVLGSADLMVSTAPDGSLIVIGVFLLAVTTVVYTWLGGMTAVVWTDVAQLVLYLGGAVVATVLLVVSIPGGVGPAATLAATAGKLTVIDLSLDLTRDYTFWSAVVGGAFFTAATHGADQMFVQRYLCCRSLRDARLALIVSGFAVFVQFGLFLVIGVLLWAYDARPPDGLAPVVRLADLPLDRVFPQYIVSHFPVGLRGLMVAAVVAAAMSTLSSSLNSSASSIVGDFSDGDSPHRPVDDAAAVRRSRLATLACALVQVGVALVAIELSQRVIDDVLQVQFFTGGVMLGIFLLVALRATTPASGMVGVGSGLVVVVLLRLFTGVSWQWYTLVGSMTAAGAGYLAARVR